MEPSSSSEDEETEQLLACSPAAATKRKSSVPAAAAAAAGRSKPAAALSIADLNREKNARMAKRRCFGTIDAADEPSEKAGKSVDWAEDKLSTWREDEDGRAEKGNIQAFKGTLGQLSDFIRPIPAAGRWKQGLDPVSDAFRAATRHTFDEKGRIGAVADSIDLGMAICTLGGALVVEAQMGRPHHGVTRWLADQVAYGNAEPASQAKALLAGIAKASAAGWRPAIDVFWQAFGHYGAVCPPPGLVVDATRHRARRDNQLLAENSAAKDATVVKPKVEPAEAVVEETRRGAGITVGRTKPEVGARVRVMFGRDCFEGVRRCL